MLGLTPASRGETSGLAHTCRWAAGSPPRRAGKPPINGLPPCPHTAHPRVARGNLPDDPDATHARRLTPASRGETRTRTLRMASASGSPPRRAGKPRTRRGRGPWPTAHPRVARGNPLNADENVLLGGLTPASRGETGVTYGLVGQLGGSPPRRAGKPAACPWRRPRPPGSPPRRAGKPQSDEV